MYKSMLLKYIIFIFFKMFIMEEWIFKNCLLIVYIFFYLFINYYLFILFVIYKDNLWVNICN